MTFFLDLWQDLRAKRLWPVAVGLLAAAVAIPVVMLKPAAEPTAPPVIAANTSDRETLPAVTVDSSPTHGSKLETFSKRNPFRPLTDLKKESTDTSAAGGPKLAAGTPASNGGSGATGASAGGGSLGSSDGGLGSSDSSSGSAPGSAPGSDGSVSPGVHYYKFTADLKFGALDKPKTMKGVETGSRLPSEDQPEILFMGLSDGATKALFFIADPTLVADGEGECDNAESCSFVKLGLGDDENEETFTTADGSVGYTLELLRLNRETVSESDATGDTKPSKGSNSKDPDGAGGKTIADASQEFLPRLISGAEVGGTAK